MKPVEFLRVVLIVLIVLIVAIERVFFLFAEGNVQKVKN